MHAARSGAEGVSAVREHNPAIVTLDLGLPDIEGFEVARQIRLFSDAYIVMLTGRADDYLSKPSRPRELRARISAMMRRPRFAEEAVSPNAALAPGQKSMV